MTIPPKQQEQLLLAHTGISDKSTITAYKGHALPMPISDWESILIELITYIGMAMPKP